jgi:hypothetical protein
MKQRDSAGLVKIPVDHRPAGSQDVGDANDGRGLPSVLQVARQLRTVLVPLEARPDFVRGLQSELAAGPASAAGERHTGERRLLWVAGAGGLLSVLGLIIIGVRLRSTALSHTSVIMNAGAAATAATAELQPAP